MRNCLALANTLTLQRLYNPLFSFGQDTYSLLVSNEHTPKITFAEMAHLPIVVTAWKTNLIAVINVHCILGSLKASNATLEK